MVGNFEINWILFVFEGHFLVQMTLNRVILAKSNISQDYCQTIEEVAWLPFQKWFQFQT